MSDETGGLTLTITGLGPWRKRATEAEALRMALHVARAEARGATGLCATCAFRPGTDANGSSLVVRCIESALVSDGNFCCHSVPEDTERLCAGFLALREGKR